MPDEQPVIKASAFAPAMALKNHSESAAEDSFVWVYPDSQLAGTTNSPPTQTTVRLSYKSPSGRAFVDFSKSLIRVRMSFGSDAGVTVRLADTTDLAISRFGASNLFSQASMKVAGKQIQHTTEHQVAASMLYATLAAESALNTNLSLVYAQPYDSDRTVSKSGYDAGQTTPEVWDLMFRPALAPFFSEKLVRAGGASWEVSLQLDPDWSKKILICHEAYEPAAADQLPRIAALTGRAGKTSGTDFHCRIHSVAWRIQQVTPRDSVAVSDQDVLDMSMLTVIPSDVANSLTSNNNFVIPVDSFKTVVGVQTVNALNCTQGPYEFQHARLNSIRIDWSGRTIPSSPYDGLGYLRGPCEEPYLDFLRGSGQLSKAEGASSSLRFWRCRQTLYCWPLSAPEGGASTNLRLTTSYDSAPAAGARVYMGFVSPLRLFMAFDPTGRMTSVSLSEENVSSNLIANA